jgi:hypothetical protein
MRDRVLSIKCSILDFKAIHTTGLELLKWTYFIQFLKYLEYKQKTMVNSTHTEFKYCSYWPAIFGFTDLKKPVFYIDLGMSEANARKLWDHKFNLVWR